MLVAEESLLGSVGGSNGCSIFSEAWVGKRSMGGQPTRDLRTPVSICGSHRGGRDFWGLGGTSGEWPL